MIWNRVPFLRILLPFILGIWLSELVPVPFVSITWIGGVLLFAMLLMRFSGSLVLPFNKQWIYGVLLNLILCAFGYVLAGSQSNLGMEAHFSNSLNGQNQGALIEVIKPVSQKLNSVQANVEVIQVLAGGEWTMTKGKAIIYFEKDSLSKSLEVGDRCMASLSLEKVRKPRNPGAFDYAKYLSRSDIHFSAYLASARWRLVELAEGFNVLRFLHSFKRGLEKSMTEVGVSKEAHSVISALTLGDKDELSSELKTAYSKAGVLHILAVSGLHVGIFYLVLNFLLGFLEKFRNGKYFKAVCIIFLLWGYVLLTGISPSVTRAATMFSFVIIGSTLNKYTNVYNTLCVSAFFLLLFQPQSLFNVGFLLSYTAVFGIVYLYPRIYGIWNVRNWFLDKVWVLLSVSLAAQVATFPLSLHYFHQFPNYFLVANVIVVPLATCVIYMALVLFALMPVELVARPIASGISHLVDMLNYFVRWIENLPYAVTDGIEIGTGEVVLIYLLIVLSVFYLQTRKYQYLISLVCLVSILAVNQVVQDVSRNKQIKLIVYDTPGQSAFDVIQGTSSLLAADSAVLTNSKTIHFVMENNWRQMGIREKLNRTTEGAQQDGLPALISVLNGARILFPLTVPEQNENNRVKVDILILSKRCKSSVQKLSEIFDIGEIVFDASIRPYKLQQFTDACTRLSIPYYSVVKSGAFVRDF